MFGFKLSKEIQEMEASVKHLETTLPADITKYELIGEGSSATVSRYPHKGEITAVKKFKTFLSKVKMIKGVRSLLNVKHVNVCQLLGYSLKPSALLFEYCAVNISQVNMEIHNLKELITIFNDNSYVSFLERRNYCKQASEGLAYLHLHKMIHKDIKPQNLLVTGSVENITVKVADYGEISAFKDTCMSSITSNKNNLQGTTLTYVSPELISGENIPSKESDIYALGLTMFEVMSTVSSPWDGILKYHTDFALKDKILNGTRPNIYALKDLYTDNIEEFCHLIENCWCSDPKNRHTLDKILEYFQKEPGSNNQCNQYQQKEVQSESDISNKKASLKEENLKRNTRKRGDKKNPILAECIDMLQKDEDLEYIEKVYIDTTIGFGVRTTKFLEKGDFVAEYCGELISKEEGEKRLAITDIDNDIRSYLYFFRHKNKNLCLDATCTFRVGRFINDSKNANCLLKIIETSDEIPHLCIFTRNPVEPFVELRYDYHEQGLPWRKKKKYKDPLYLPPDISKVDVEVSEQSYIKGLDYKKSSNDIACDSDEVLPPTPQKKACLSWSVLKSHFVSPSEDSMEQIDSYVGDVDKIDFNLQNSVIDLIGNGSDDDDDDDVEMETALKACAAVTGSAMQEASQVCESRANVELNEIEAVVESVIYDLVEDVVLAREGGIEQEAHPLHQVPVLNDSGFEVDADQSVIDSEDIDDDDDDEEENLVSESAPNANCKVEKNPENNKSGTYKKPKRCCIFCGKLTFKLTRHITLVHKKENRVKAAMNLHKKERVKEFKKMRREGIIQFNRKESEKEIPSYQGERKRRKYQELMFCSCCSAFISKRFFSTHKRLCTTKNDGVVVGIPLQSISKNVKLSDAFKNNVVSKIRDDEVGKLIRKEDNILYLGNKFFKKLEHKKEKLATVYKSVRNDMRQLALLYQEFLTIDGVNQSNSSLLDLFNRENFDFLCEAIERMTTNEDNTLKAGLRHNLYYLLLKSVKKLRDKMFLEKKDDCFKEMDSFYKSLKSNEDIIVSSARYQLENTSLKKRRKPAQLPVEEDIKKIHDFIMQKMKELVVDYEFWTSHSFIELRNLVMARLTLLNARRGGEVGRLMIPEWKDAQEGGWINKQQIEKLSKSDQMLVNAMKIVYLTGKGNRHLVSLLVPEDTISALTKLCDPIIRSQSGISSSNSFIFASTQLSELNFSGWHALNCVCSKLKLQNPSLINATNNRHRISTYYAALDIPEKERELFYTHMGHSSDINKDVYQAPLAIMGVTKVGKQLLKMDGGLSTEKELPKTSTRLLTKKEKEHTPDDLNTKKSYSLRKAHRNAENSVDEEAEDVVEEEKTVESNIHVETDVDDEDEDETYEPDDQDLQSINIENRLEEKLFIRKKSAKWTDEIHRIFMKRFGGYVKQTEPRLFPSRAEMIEFVDSLGNPFPHGAVRTKINNERKKFAENKKKALATIGL